MKFDDEDDFENSEDVIPTEKGEYYNAGSAGAEKEVFGRATPSVTVSAVYNTRELRSTSAQPRYGGSNALNVSMDCSHNTSMSSALNNTGSKKPAVPKLNL